MTASIDDVVDDGVTASATPPTRRLPPWTATALVALVVVVGIALRFVQRSPLWLDEALSVNIARLPLDELLDALRHDGHPPLYYVLLHVWMELFGEGDTAVRALSGLFAVASLPLVWLAGRRVAGVAGGRWALVVAATSPYWVRYATETRMYSLVMLLVLGGYLLVTDALARPDVRRLVGIGVISGLLLLTHYWAFYLLAAVGGLLVLRAWRHPERRPNDLRVVGALAAGGVLFLPWLGGFLYQAANTGTPWGEPFRPTAVVQATLMDMGGGTVSEASLYGALVVVLALVALFTARSTGLELGMDLRTVPRVRRELLVALVVLGIGGVIGYLTNATYQSRYAAVVVPLVLLAVAAGIAVLPRRARLVAAALYLGLAFFGLSWVNFYQRTQAAEVADAVAERAEPGDVVVYCPDQLGPAYSRAMPEGLVEMTYPTLDAPDRVDWVDYEERNQAADPGAVADDVLDVAGDNAVFLVWMADYNTFDEQCQDLIGELGLTDNLVIQDQAHFYEPAFLQWRPALD